MYNLDVVGNDNFFVGEESWLVHNAGIEDCGKLIGVNFTKTVEQHMKEPSRYVPAQLLEDTIANNKPFLDPRGTPFKFHYSPITINGKNYNLEVLYDSATNTIMHFKYTPKAIGPLPAIPKPIK